MEGEEIKSSAHYSDEEELQEKEATLKSYLESGKYDIKKLLPPPKPLLPKALMPSEPAFQAQNIPFVRLGDFIGTEEAEPQALPVDKSQFPARFPPDTTFRSLFESSKLVYERNSSQEGFNSNTCNLKTLLTTSHGSQNPMLFDSIDPYHRPTDQTLIFESRFESGNLSMASKLSESEYNLLLQNDINSKGHTQWFFFRVSNTRAKQSVKFNILNFAKADSLFNHGMKVAVYSMKSADREGVGWTRGGSDIMYYPNGIRRGAKSYYTLTFTFTFSYSFDIVYLAYSIPYTYTQLQQSLDNFEKDPETSQYFNRKTLCRTLGGNPCDYLTITNKGTIEEVKSRRSVVFSGRVHPGETVGSWMMHGLLEFLLSSHPEANALRQNYVIKVLPMLNPDGVINGNYRCSLVGADLNRRWKSPVQVLHPVIYNFKRLIKSTASNYNIDLICDMHGHSRKKNIFIYGCNISKSPQTCKIFPYIVSKVSPVFSFQYSRFGVQKSKESTMRVALFKELKVPTIYTLEASFCGGDMGSFKGLHYTTEALKRMGRDIARSLLVIARSSKMPAPLAPKRTVKKIKGAVGASASQMEIPDESGLKELDPEVLLDEMMHNEELLHNGEAEDSSSGSDSEPSEDNLEVEELKDYIPSLSLKKKPKPKSKPKPAPQPRVMRQPTRKKCNKCGQDELPGHTCPEAPPPPKRKPVGIRTYYNIAGKRVHDQATQTPLSFYPKMAKIRAETQGDFRGSLKEDSKTPTSLETKSDQTSKLEKNNERKSISSTIRRSFFSEIPKKDLESNRSSASSLRRSANHSLMSPQEGLSSTTLGVYSKSKNSISLSPNVSK